MLTIIYDSNDDDYSISDGNAFDEASRIIETYFKFKTNEFVIANELMILAFRVLVKEGRISHKEIQFQLKYNFVQPEVYLLNKDGRFIDGDFYVSRLDNFLSRLI